MCENQVPVLRVLVGFSDHPTKDFVIQSNLAELKKLITPILDNKGVPEENDLPNLFLALLRTYAFDQLDAWDEKLTAGETVMLVAGAFCANCFGPMGFEWSASFSINLTDEGKDLIKVLEDKSKVKISPLKFSVVRDVLEQYLNRAALERVQESVIIEIADPRHNRLN
jgi:hypothetical protein